MTLHESIARDRSSALTGRLALSCAILLSVQLLALVAVGGFALSAYGYPSLPPVLTAWLLCTFASLAALVISARFACTPYAMHVHLGTMLIRMGLPLAGLLLLPRLFTSLDGAGLIYAMIPLYLIALLTETLLSTRHVSPAPRAASTLGNALKA